VWHKEWKMADRKGQEHISTYVPVELAAAFKELARQTDGSAAATLRRLIAQAVDEANRGQGLHGASPVQAAIAPRGVGRGEQVGVRFKGVERQALAEAAQLQRTSPANWLRSLALVHLVRRPQWNEAEVEALRAVFRELRAIGNNVNQMAHALNIATTTGMYPLEQGNAAREAVELVRFEMRRVVAVMTGNFDYWGLPDAERPTAAPGALKRARLQAQMAEARRKSKPKRRPARFADGDNY
jgi:Bacterial mobilisation protein (MobC)